MDRIEALAGHPGRRLTSCVRDDLSAEERAALRVLCERLRAAIERAHAAFGGEAAEESLRSAIRGEGAVLWATIEDAMSPALRGYGPLSPEAAAVVDAMLGDLSELFAAVVRSVAGRALERVAHH